MHMFPRLPLRHLSAVASLALLCAGAGSASAQTVINSVPYTISAAGKYVLGSNLSNTSTTVPAITVNAPNVSLDLNGFYLSGAGNTASQNAIIYVANVANVSIRNGLVSNDGYGIYFNGDTNARNYTVENLTISRCYLDGLIFFNAAPGSLVRTNSFSNLGNSTASASVASEAIYTSGGVRVESNSVATVTATGDGQASTGIDAIDSDFIVRNTISNCTVGITGGKYQDNLTSGCTTPFTGGTDAGGNN